jgi:MoaA/NifB/PqqE/SkfB family radical SAM enzyme
MYSRAYVEIINTCNMHCSFCHGTKRESRAMSLGEFARIVGNLRGVTEYLYLHVLGEPLTHPMLPTFIEYATKSGFKVAITTNGTLLSKLGEALINSGVYKVNISLHSFERYGSQKAQNNYISSCIAFADEASRRGVLCVLRLWNKVNQENSIEEKLNDYTLALLREHFGNDWSFGARGARIRNKLHLEYGERFEWPDSNNESLGERVFCHGLSDHFGILCDGTVIPCCLDADGAIPLGNIFESDIRTILSSDRANAIKDGFQNKTAVEDLCLRCPYARRFKV